MAGWHAVAVFLAAKPLNFDAVTLNNQDACQLAAAYNHLTVRPPALVHAQPGLRRMYAPRCWC